MYLTFLHFLTTLSVWSIFQVLSLQNALWKTGLGHRYSHFILSSLIVKGVELVEVCGVAKLWVLERSGIQLENLLE